MAERLLLVDGHGYAYRSFYAIRGMRSPAGRPTNAIFGFVKTLAKLRTTISPSHLVVVWDGGLDDERLRALPEYKAQRPEMPGDLAGQITEIQQWLPVAGVASFCQDAVEADDMIGALAVRGAAAGCDVVVASSDKDFMQLVGPGVRLVNPNDKVDRFWGDAEVLAKLGVRPGQVVDYLGLIGDAVDNIPGVPGVGPKTAVGLLARFGSVDELYARLSEVESVRVRGALAAAEGQVRRNLNLVRLRVDLPQVPDLGSLALREPDWGRLQSLYASWGFRGLLAEAEARGGGGRQGALL
jgi:DNA polymerase-1